jgi:hypothetical protein
MREWRETCEGDREEGKEEREVLLFTTLPFELVVPFVGGRYSAWPPTCAEAIAETICVSRRENEVLYPPMAYRYRRMHGGHVRNRGRAAVVFRNALSAFPLDIYNRFSPSRSLS